MGVFFTLLYIVLKYSFRLIQNYPFQATWPRFSPIYSCLVIETKLFTFLHYATFISSLSSVFSVNSRKAEHERCHFSSSQMKYLGRRFTSVYILAIYSPTMPVTLGHPASSHPYLLQHSFRAHRFLCRPE